MLCEEDDSGRGSVAEIDCPTGSDESALHQIDELSSWADVPSYLEIPVSEFIEKPHEKNDELFASRRRTP